MPLNSQADSITVFRDVSAVAKVTMAPDLTGLRIRKVPANPGLGLPGTLVVLPANPSEGDTYEIVNSDQSVDFNHLIVISPDPSGTATVGGTPAFPLLQPGSGASVTFDSEQNDWTVSLDANGVFLVAAKTLATGVDQNPGNLTANTNAAIILAAFIFGDPSATPRTFTTAGGDYQLDFKDTFTLSAGDTVTIEVFALNNITTLAGGNDIFGPLGTLAYEAGQGAGQVISYTATETPVFTWKKQVAAGEIAAVTAAFSALMTNAQAIGNANPIGFSIKIVTAGGAQITSQALMTSIRQVV